MDAKVDGWVVTPRTGKPVEVNALWINALRACAVFAALLGEDARPYADAAARAPRELRALLERRARLVLRCDRRPGSATTRRSGRTRSSRSSLPIDVLDPPRRRAIVDVCASRLWTPAGLRTLAPGDPRYCGRYGGDRRARDGAYHNGTVWTWLAGPFALAHARVYGDREGARDLLAACADGLAAGALGTLGGDRRRRRAVRRRAARSRRRGASRRVLDAWTALA